MITQQTNQIMSVLDKKTYIIHWSSHRIEILCLPLDIWICPTNPGDALIETMGIVKSDLFSRYYTNR